MNIELEKDTVRGNRKIIVDGKHWGTVVIHHHGCHGPDYTFRQVGGGEIEDVTEKRTWVWRRPVRVKSKTRRWSNAGDERDTHTRIIDKATELVNADRLRDPAVVEAERIRANDLWMEGVERDKREQRVKDEATAMALIDAHDSLESSFDFAERIADALEKARTE